MIRVAAERGQAPLSLRPYLPVDQLPYHWGYHVLVAAAMQLSSLDLPQAMLVTGQALNVLHVLAAAGLAAYLWRRPLAGIAAALAVGLLSIFPAYYVSWGRYTQLTGLLLLPPLMIAWLELLKASRLTARTAEREREPASAIGSRFVPAGARSRVLSRYKARDRSRAAAGGAESDSFHCAGLCALFYGRERLRLGARRNPDHDGGARRALWWSRLARAAGSAALALILAGPWLWLLAARALLRSGTGQAPALLGQGAFYALDTHLLWAGNNRMLIALALAAALWGIRRRKRRVAVLLAWVAALCVLANPWLALYVLPAVGAALLAWSLARRRVLPALGGGALLLLNPLLIGKLPYIAIISTETVVISLFLPIGVLLGGGAVLLWDFGLQIVDGRLQIASLWHSRLLVSVANCFCRRIEHLRAVGRVGSARCRKSRDRAGDTGRCSRDQLGSRAHAARRALFDQRRAVARHRPRRRRRLVAATTGRPLDQHPAGTLRLRPGRLRARDARAN